MPWHPGTGLDGTASGLISKSEVNQMNTPSEKQRSEPTEDPFVQGYIPSICPVHGYNLRTSTDGGRYCPKCASGAFKQKQLDKIRTDSANVARDGTAQPAKHYGP